jgi:hypothetical protein
MFGWNFGLQPAWGRPQAYNYSNYSPWGSWTHTLYNSPQLPYSQVYQFQDTFTYADTLNVMGGQGVSHSQEMQQQGDYMRRLQVLQMAGPGAERKIPNWRTMPFNDLLLAVARLKGAGNTNVNPGQAQRLPVNVNAQGYWEGNERIPVSKVTVWELGGGPWEDKWNTARFDRYNTSFDRGIKGKTYRVTVEWANGRRYEWDHVNDGTTIEVWQPNR